jgi:hypothetical protein
MSAMKVAGRLMAGLLLVAAVAYGVVLYRHLSWVAGGADSSGYLNEARLMTAGSIGFPIKLLTTLHLESEWNYILVPLGFRASDRDPHLMVPIYPPGLPAHLAIAGAIGGWARAPFLVPPLAGLACLALMFVLGRQFGLSKWESVAASAILAACPVFLFMEAQPMSDILATAWTLAAIVCALAAERRPRFAAAAGAAFAISVCVRPSNLLMAVPFAFALRWRLRPMMIAVAAALPFAIALTTWNHALFGGAATTGYGSMTYMLAWDYPRVRVPHYSYWLAAQLTPLIFPGGLFVAIDRRLDGWRRALLVTWFLVIFTFYCFYQAYETWWYTRFLLPGIPPLIIGFLLLLRDFRVPRLVVPILIVAILGVEVWQVRQLDPLSVGVEESIYPETIRWAEQQLPPDAIVLNGQFSGAFLYYSGRQTIRWDQLDNDERFQLLRAYVGSANLHWYAVLSQFEWEQVQKRFKGGWTPLGEHRDVKLLRLDS